MINKLIMFFLHTMREFWQRKRISGYEKSLIDDFIQITNAFEFATSIGDRVAFSKVVRIISDEIRN